MLPHTEHPANGAHDGPQSPARLVSYLARYLVCLLSSIQWRRLLKPKVLFGWEDVVSRSTDTAWLDGLRGVAAVQVFFFHFFGRYIQWGHTYGSTPEDRSFHQLTIFRPIYFGGPGAVSVFFVISGYAITVKSFMLIRQRRLDDMYRGLSSSLFRRLIRLYGPLILVSIPALILSLMMDMSPTGYMYKQEMQDSALGQIIHFFASIDDHLNPFAYKDNGDKGPVSRYAYVPQSWTIPMEYYGSITCYIMVLMVARVESFRMRATILAGVTFYAVHRGCWWASNFVFGMLLADWILERKSNAVAILESSQSSSSPSTLPPKKSAAWLAVFFAGWYLEGLCPKVMAFDFSPVPRIGYETLYKLRFPEWLIQVPEDARWYWYLSGNLLVLGVSQHPRLKAMFESRFCQWLGKLSYALYLCHFLILASLMAPVEGFIKRYTESTPIICFFVWSVDSVLILIASTFIERYADRPSVQFAKYVETRFFQQDRVIEQPEKGQPLRID